MNITEPFDSGNIKIRVAEVMPGEEPPEGFFFDHFRRSGVQCWIEYLGPSEAMKALYADALQVVDSEGNHTFILDSREAMHAQTMA